MKEEIIKLAKEAGMVVYDGDQDRVLFEGSVMDCLTRFFHMAQAAEREACIELTDSRCQCAWLIKERGQA